MLYEYKCECGHRAEEFFPYKDYQSTIPCPVCFDTMHRVFTTFALHEPKRKTPNGMVELGNDYPSVKEVDHMDGIEQTINEVLDSGVDLDGSGDLELNKLSA
jgi:putative FmdB family regulatory protein